MKAKTDRWIDSRANAAMMMIARSMSEYYSRIYFRKINLKKSYISRVAQSEEGV